MNSMKKNIWGIVVLVLIVAAAGVSFSFLTTAKGTGLDGFARCLASKDAVMYGAYWCPHCQNQKRLFGDSFRYVRYVECASNPKECTDAGVDGFPTWIIGNGPKLVGEQSLAALATATDCPLPSSTMR